MTVCNYTSYTFTWLVVQGVSLHKYHLKSVPETYYTMITKSLKGRRASSHVKRPPASIWFMVYQSVTM